MPDNTMLTKLILLSKLKKIERDGTPLYMNFTMDTDIEDLRFAVDYYEKVRQNKEIKQQLTQITNIFKSVQGYLSA